MANDPHDTDTRDERVDRVILAYLGEVDAGREPDRRALLADHPDLADELREFFADQDRLARLARAAGLAAPAETTDEAARADADDAPAAVGGYRLLRLLGAGGMGRVYEAEGPGGQRVAVKLLAPGLADSPTTLERFRQEGRLASRLTHPRCVFIHTADQDAGRPYIVMELMSGATLKDLVERGGPLEPGDAVARILDVIEGLEEAHQAGVLHRDVKPANCYLGADGRVKVGDFGLSRSLAAASHLTRTGGFVGTPLFASPEQLKGEPLDARTDVYSVAATLYYLLTGRAPFQHAEGATVIARAVSEPAPPPRRLRPDIPPALEEAVLRGLERARERRFPDLPAFREALRPLMPGQMTIAGLGLRVGAILLDTLPLTVCGQAAGMVLVSRGQPSGIPFLLAVAVPTFFYFWLSDGLWGCSVAKWLLRLRVTRAGGWERPGLGRALLRTLVLIATGGLLAEMVADLFVDQRTQPITWSAWMALGSALSLAARFSTMRRRNGYRGLHEVLSDTRVVQLPPSPPRRIGPEPRAAGGPAVAPCAT
ncbi:MAG TPA: protein kinase, partial [Gemmataceae bacterium]|nr:protein kinase [Gemmataceae bacterium]